MKRFCKNVVGSHDFAGFSSSGRTVEDTVRTVSYCDIISNDEFIKFSVTADGFLYNMVRILAGTCLDVGYGKLNPDIADTVFETKDRSSGGDTLPAKGLFLNKVMYECLNNL